jgi:PAS domain S-box-containing protein
MQPKQAQKVRPAGERLFQSLFDAASIGIAVEDLEGQPLYANPALCSMLGFNVEELRSKHCVEFSPPEDARKDWALFDQLRQGSIEKYHLEKRFFRKDGTLIWGRLSISLMNGHAGSSPLVVAMVEDITEKRVAEEKLQRSEANLQHLASRLIQIQEEERQRIGRELHDDVGQRLSLILLGLEELRDSLSAGQNSQSQLALDIHRKTYEVAADLQNISRDFHSGKLEFLGLYGTLRNLCEEISKQKHIHITLDAEGFPATLPPDLELCIFRVAQEALNNVVKHSRSARAFVELTHVDDTMILKVKDLGVGFDPSTSHPGIGLSSMRERLRMFGGELLVQSVPSKGTDIVAKVQLGQAAKGAAGSN